MASFTLSSLSFDLYISYWVKPEADLRLNYNSTSQSKSSLKGVHSLVLAFDWISTDWLGTRILTLIFYAHWHLKIFVLHRSGTIVMNYWEDLYINHWQRTNFKIFRSFNEIIWTKFTYKMNTTLTLYFNSVT